MKVTLSWLREFAPFDDDIDRLGSELSLLGLAVEEQSRLGEGLDGIVVAEVLDLSPHPDADRIQIVQVDAGDGEALQICCGAFNMSVGDRVPLATIGTTMPNGMEIAARKMRGQASNGMLCSSTEIGLGTDADGIMLLDTAIDGGAASIALGTPITEALGMEPDVLWDLEVNPNRPDAMSVAGVARDLAAAVGVPFDIPDIEVPTTGPSSAEELSIRIDDTDLCGRFVARVLHGVAVGTSPAWMQRRLLQLGMRPINSVVDVSNYVMLERGQPNHTYDLDLVEGRTLAVRRARQGETIETLDGVTRELIPTDGVIVDGADTPIGIAGVMGGASTEISESTRSVALEMAWWRPEDIARTTKRLGLRSEASMRFERGADPDGGKAALDRFCELLIAQGATVAPGTLDEAGVVPDRTPIRVRSRRVNAVLGTQLTAEEMANHLRSIEFEVTTEPAEEADDADLAVTVPSFRPDTATETDVAEEIARMHGYARITRTVPRPNQTGGLSELQQERRTLRRALAGIGLDEAMPLPFLAPDTVERCGLSLDSITLSNPLAAEESVLRPSLRPGLLQSVAHNLNHRQSGVALFEIGRQFRPTGESGLPDEREMLAVVLAGEEAPAAVAVWDAVAVALGFADHTLEAAELDGLHPTRAATISVPGASGTPVVIGEVGEIDPGVLADLDIEARVAWLEVDVSRLLAAPHGAQMYTRVSRYPSSDVDLAFVVDDAIAAGDVEASLEVAGGDLLVDLALFDVYRGQGVADSARSLAYRLRFQAPDRTLTDDEVGAARQACIEKVTSTHGAQLRG